MRPSSVMKRYSTLAPCQFRPLHQASTSRYSVSIVARAGLYLATQNRKHDDDGKACKQGAALYDERWGGARRCPRAILPLLHGCG